MTVEQAIWTALPHGITEDGRLRVSVHVAPRLRNDDGGDAERKLGDFPTFLNWADRVNEMDFVVDINGDLFETQREDAADPGLWSFLFSKETVVIAHKFQDHAKRDIHVHPVRPLLQFLENAYGTAAGAGPNLPSVDDPTGPLSSFAPLANLTNRITDSQSYFQELDRARSKERGDGKVVFESVADPSLPAAAQQAQNAFFQAYRFYNRPGSRNPDLPDDYIEPSPKPQAFDFHQILSGVADFPFLMRRLGIVIDLVVDVPFDGVQPGGVVKVIPRGQLPEDPPNCPGTRYEIEDRWFGARPESYFRMRRGLLRLSPEVYDLFQVDIDGAALQVIGFAAIIEAMKNPETRSDATESTTGIPALRSAGMALARTARGQNLLADLLYRRQKNQDLELAKEVVFYAEDLVRGYRVDVWDRDAGDPGWFSLHMRRVEHSPAELPGPAAPFELIEVSDEGYIKATSASSENSEHPNPSDDLYLHETVAGWDGWSLSAPRPGKRIVEPGKGDGGSSIAHHDPAEGVQFPIVNRVSVQKGSLPRLRIGHLYRMRARTVDLAGNSVDFTRDELEPDDPTLASEPQNYLRFEPVPSPAILRRHLDTEGESVEHLVIRSNLGVTAAEYPDRPEVVQALADANAPHSYAGDSQRHLAPPKASEQMVEQDGKLDSAFGGTPAQATAALRIALREEGTFLDDKIVDLATGQKTVSQSTIALYPPSANLPASRGQGLVTAVEGAGAYAYYPEGSLELPYLPDPLAIGVALTGYDFTGKEVFHQRADFSNGWPALKPMRLLLSEGPLGAEFVGDVLQVRLPKAEVVWARLSSVFPRDRLEDLAIWNWVPAPKRSATLKAQALAGRHTMFTPFRQLTLSHAVQQPLAVPDMTAVTSIKSLGSTFASFRGPLSNHAKSTSRLDVYGEWTEDIDLLTDDAPKMRATGNEVAHRAQAFGFEISRYEDKAEIALHAARHEFGDTKHRRIVYHSVATTRFREFLPPPLTAVPANIQREESALDGGGNVNPALVHNILSSSRPAAPEVVQVLPTFRWELTEEGNQVRHVRRGKAVRVWLRRPWFSSGDDEKLGVILEPGVRLPKGWQRVPAIELPGTQMALGTPRISILPLVRENLTANAEDASLEPQARIFMGEISAEKAGIGSIVGAILEEEAHRMLRPYVTDWGLDPVWNSALPSQPPTVADFPQHSGYAGGLTLEELPKSFSVVVAAHDVHFDEVRKLWYCDIEIDPGNTYYPFVRLALSRYQANSVTDAHLSKVVMTDFIQLAPDRTARVTITENSAEVAVSGYGGRNIVADLVRPSLIEAPKNAGPNTSVRVVLERRIPGIPGDLGWQRVGPEISLPGTPSGFFVTWTGTVALPAGTVGKGTHRLVIAEYESYLREDLIPGDPNVSTSPADFVRERVVYADTFEL